MRDRPFFAVIGATLVALAFYANASTALPHGIGAVSLATFAVAVVISLWRGSQGLTLAGILAAVALLACRAHAFPWTDAGLLCVSFPLGGAGVVLLREFHFANRREREHQERELLRLARKQEEQLVHSTRLAEMGEMAAGVAHELNQPLTGIKNFARNATFMLEAYLAHEDGGNIEDVKENLRLIVAQVDRASRIISQMRELARKADRHLAPVDINAALRESVEFVMPQLRLSGVSVDFLLDPALPTTVCDRIRMEQVFLNLLTNARHAMEEAPERILKVRTHYDGTAARPVVIEISDTGKGFAPDVAEKLFTPFFSTKQATRGTGLGLSISLGIVKDHDGTIEAVGAADKGATFTVRLPLVQSDPAEEPSRT